MAEMYTVNGDDLTDIGDAIRLKTDSSAPIEIPDMANMIRMIEGGDLPSAIAEIAVTTNQYDPNIGSLTFDFGISESPDIIHIYSDAPYPLASGNVEARFRIPRIVMFHYWENNASGNNWVIKYTYINYGGMSIIQSGPGRIVYGTEYTTSNTAAGRLYTNNGMRSVTWIKGDSGTSNLSDLYPAPYTYTAVAIRFNH